MDVGIEKHQDRCCGAMDSLPAGMRFSRPSRWRALDAYDSGSQSRCDLPGTVRRGIVDDDEFVLGSQIGE
jgi:hypothetical protein